MGSWCLLVVKEQKVGGTLGMGVCPRRQTRQLFALTLTYRQIGSFSESKMYIFVLWKKTKEPDETTACMSSVSLVSFFLSLTLCLYSTWASEQQVSIHKSWLSPLQQSNSVLQKLQDVFFLFKLAQSNIKCFLCMLVKSLNCTHSKD